MSLKLILDLGNCFVEFTINARMHLFLCIVVHLLGYEATVNVLDLNGSTSMYKVRKCTAIKKGPNTRQQGIYSCSEHNR